MSHLAETVVIPPIAYESNIKREDLKMVKLKHVSGLVPKEKKVPIFDGRDGIEGLLYCEEAVRDAFVYLNVTAGQEMFNLYKDTLSGNALRKWNNVVGSITAANQTVDRFDRSIKRFYERFVDDKARNTMYDYLKTRECGKAFKTTVLDHVDRMEELYRYSAKLPGTVPSMDDNDPDDAEQIKELIFITFPEAWQIAFEDAHDIETSSQIVINKFMNRQKAKDARLERRKKASQARKSGNHNENKQDKKDKGEKKKGKGSGRNNNGKRTKKQLQKDDPCPIHGGGHSWNDCFDNKNGPNFRPPRPSRGQSRGRSERREGHYQDEYHYSDDRRSRRSPSPARRAPSPPTWNETHHYERSRSRGSASRAGTRFVSKSRSNSRW